MDPGMHVKILRLVNSAAFGLARKVSNLGHAVTLLGRARIETMVLSLAVMDSLPLPHNPCMSSSRFWLVATKRAGLARMLALHLHAATQAECFTAALLQDIGIPLLSTAKEDTYCPLLEQWNSNPSLELISAEKELLGYNHAQVGAVIAEYWGLPDYLINAIGGHHGSTETDVDPAVKLVSHLRYNDEDDGRGEIISACWEEYHVEEELVRNMIEKAFEDAEKTAEIFQ